jgi:hypothetical protein
MRLALRPAIGEARPIQPGSAMHVLVLCPSRHQTVVVDLGSGSFVRMTHDAPRDSRSAPRYGDVAVGRLSGDVDLADPLTLPTADAPLAYPLKKVGQMKPRQIEKTLLPLVHPVGKPLFGCEGPALPMWSVGSVPAISLVEPETDVTVTMTTAGLCVRFGWRGYNYQMPLEDRRVLRRLDWLPNSPVKGRALAEVIGFFPSRMLLGLGEPINGYCYKTAVALLR